MTDPATLPRAGVLRRLAALLYDGLLALAVLFVATAVTLPFTGEGVSGNPLVSTWLFVVLFLFFAWFWTHGGQTLGMRAWRIRLLTHSGGPVTLTHALLRFVTALPAWGLIILGTAKLAAGDGLVMPVLPGYILLVVGLVWLVADQWPDSWRDRFSETVLVVEPKRRKD